MNKRVIIDDVWYVIGDKEFFIYDWPEDCKEIFKDIFKII